jgi:ribosome-associated protein
LALPLHVAPTITVPASAITVRVSRSSGPGGQNVNKVSSKVELLIELSAVTGLDDAAQARLRRLAGRRLDGEGRLVITSQKTRDQHRNLEDAREKASLLISRALEAPTPRRPTRPGTAAKRARLSGKKRRGEKKALRRRPQAED